MTDDLFKLHQGLAGSRRLTAPWHVGRRIAVHEVCLLIVAGGLAAFCSAYLRLGLRVPGSAVIWAIVPMALGLSMVPRRFGGVVMSGSALATASLLSATGAAHYGVGALTSLCLSGPMMDVAVLGVNPGWQVYTRLVAAGFCTNALAFLQRGFSKVAGLDQPGTRQFGEWVGQALVTYAASGAIAGLVAALCWFELRRGRPREATR